MQSDLVWSRSYLTLHTMVPSTAPSPRDCACESDVFWCPCQPHHTGKQGLSFALLSPNTDILRETGPVTIPPPGLWWSRHDLWPAPVQSDSPCRWLKKPERLKTPDWILRQYTLHKHNLNTWTLSFPDMLEETPLHSSCLLYSHLWSSPSTSLSPAPCAWFCRALLVPRSTQRIQWLLLWNPPWPPGCCPPSRLHKTRATYGRTEEEEEDVCYW